MFTVTPAGYVGIGTCTPDGMLHIVNPNGITAAPIFERSNLTSDLLYTTLKLRANKNTAAGPDFGSMVVFETVDNDLVVNTMGQFAFYRDDADNSSNMLMNTYKAGVANYALRIDQDANIGINLSSFDATTAKLEVSAGGSATDLLMLSSNDNSNGDRFIVKNSGSVGIGTTSPIATLTVKGTTTAPTINLLVVASSTGTAILTVAPNGSTTLSSLGTGCVGVSSDSLYTTTCGGGSVSGSGSVGKLAVWTGSTALGDSILYDNGAVAGINATSSSFTFNI